MATELLPVAREAIGGRFGPSPAQSTRLRRTTRADLVADANAIRQGVEGARLDERERDQHVRYPTRSAAALNEIVPQCGRGAGTSGDLLAFGRALRIGPLLNVVAGIVYALAPPYVALATCYTYFDALARDSSPRTRHSASRTAAVADHPRTRRTRKRRSSPGREQPSEVANLRAPALSLRARPRPAPPRQRPAPTGSTPCPAWPDR